MAHKQIIVVGLGRFGLSIAKTLYQLGHDVLAIDTQEARVQEALEHSTYAVRADATSESVVRELGAPSFDIAIVAIGSDVESNIMSTVLLKSVGVPYVISRARTHLHGQTLERVGANQVIYPEQELGIKVARSLFHPDVLDYMELAPNVGISKIKVPEHLRDMTLKEAGMATARDKYGLAVVAVKRGKDLILLPAEEEKLEADDLLFIASRDDLLAKLHLE